MYSQLVTVWTPDYTHVFARLVAMHRAEDVPPNRRMSQCADEEWIEHQLLAGAAVYSPQYSDDEFVYRWHIAKSLKMIVVGTSS